MAFEKRPVPWVNNDDVFPEDLNRYENALEDHEEKLEGMTTVEESEVNGNIKVNDIEVVVYRILNDLVNSLDSTATNKGLTAAAGKLLAEQTSILSTNRGYKTSKGYQNISVLSLRENGKYELYGGSITDLPVASPNPSTSIQVDVTWNARGIDAGLIELEYIYPLTGKWKNTCVSGAWQGWKQIATDIVLNVPLTNPVSSTDIRVYIALMKKQRGYFVGIKSVLTNLTNVPVLTEDAFCCEVSGGVLDSNGFYYATLRAYSLSTTSEIHECQIFNNGDFTSWKQIATVDKSLQFLPIDPSGDVRANLKDGIYKTLANMTNMPIFSSMPTPQSTEGELQVTKWLSEGYYIHRFKSLYGGEAVCVCVAGSWLPWNISATHDKTAVLFYGGFSSGTATLSHPIEGYHELAIQANVGTGTGAVDKLYAYTFPGKLSYGTYKMATANGPLTVNLNGTSFAIVSNPNNLTITVITGVLRGNVY